MKKTALMLLMALMGAVAFAAAPAKTAQTSASKMSLAEAKGQIDAAIENPEVMKSIMKSLSAEDQKTFLADVNAAIKTMPCSEAERVATFVAVDRAALKGAAKGNVATLVAEIFATITPTALAAMTDSLGSDLLNRATAANQTYTDEQYIKIGQAVMAKVNPRAAEVDHSDVRSGFAALMFIRGSNTPTEEIVNAFVATLPPAVQQTAKTEWYPSAIAEGDDRNYDAMLAAADVDPAEADPSAGVSAVNGNLSGIINLRVAGPQLSESLIADVAGASTDPGLRAAAFNPVYDAVTAPIQHGLPNLGAGEAANDVAQTINAVVEEAKGYQWQNTK